MFTGGVLFFVFNGEQVKTMRTASIFLFLGGIIGGCFSTPSRGMPNGMPGASAVSIAFLLIGIYYFVKAIKRSSTDEADVEKGKSNSKGLLIVAGLIFAIFVVMAFVDHKSMPSTPWEDLGVSQKEYMDIYYFFKYGEHP